MATRVFHTNDPEVAQFEIQQKFKNPREWKVTEPMMTRKEAQEWEKAMCAEHGHKNVVLQTKKLQSRERWYGVMFSHDGPKGATTR
jgi:hypothetical protein